MKIILLLSLSAFSAFAFSKNFNFFYSGIEGNRHIFLACDYAEDASYAILEKLGATDIEVYCSGGIQNGTISPISLRGKFEASQDTNSGETIILESINGNCFFETKLIDATLQLFDDIQIISRRRHCFNSDDSYKYTLKKRVRE